MWWEWGGRSKTKFKAYFMSFLPAPIKSVSCHLANLYPFFKSWIKCHFLDEHFPAPNLNLFPLFYCFKEPCNFYEIVTQIWLYRPYNNFYVFLCDYLCNKYLSFPLTSQFREWPMFRLVPATKEWDGWWMNESEPPGIYLTLPWTVAYYRCSQGHIH